MNLSQAMLLASLLSSGIALGESTSQRTLAPNAAPEIPQSRQPSSSRPTRKEAPPTLLLALPDRKFAVFRRMEEAARTEATSTARLVVVDGGGDANLQRREILAALDKGADALIFDPADESMVGPILEAVHRRQVPLIALDRAVPGSGALRISADSFELGRRVAREAARLLAGKGRLMTLGGPAGNSVAREIQRGYEEELALYPDIAIVVKADAEWSRAAAFRATAAALKSGRIDAILAHNDAMALGAVSAASSVPTRLRPFILGADADDEAIAAMRHGALIATVDKHPDRIAREAVRLAVRLSRGQPVSSRDIAGRAAVEDGAPVVYTPVEMILAEETSEAGRRDAPAGRQRPGRVREKGKREP